MRRQPLKFVSPQDLSRPKVYLYADAYSLAGFIFEKREGAVCPVGSFQMDASDITESLDEWLVRAGDEHHIQRVAVPPVFNKQGLIELLHNQLYQSIRPPFVGEVMRWEPEPIQAMLLRASALKRGTLNESFYPRRAKLTERLKQLSPDREPSAYVMSYLNAVYDLLRAVPAQDHKPKGGIRHRNYI